MAERTIAEEIEFVRRCLNMLDDELTRWDNNEKPVMSPSGLLCPVLNARAALDRMKSMYKKEMDEAAEHINNYLEEIPTNPRVHNWLMRNGYKDESYQADVFGQGKVIDDYNKVGAAAGIGLGISEKAKRMMEERYEKRMLARRGVVSPT